MNTPLEAFRSFYARHIAAGAPGIAERLVSAFEAVPREHFLGKGPWRVFTATGYISTPSDDPAFLYQDIVVALPGDGPINNGQPSLHAACLASVDPANGETVLHIGAGTGYYTAVLAKLVGQTGTVSLTKSTGHSPNEQQPLFGRFLECHRPQSVRLIGATSSCRHRLRECWGHSSVGYLARCPPHKRAFGLSAHSS